MRLIYRFIREVIVYLKFKNVKFAHLGKNCDYKYINSFYAYPDNIYLNDYVHIGDRCQIDGAGKIVIGRGTRIAPEVIIYSRSHNFEKDPKALPYDNTMIIAPVTIGEFVWIGTRVIILPGVTIGDGAIIGAGAVVSRDIPACAVVVGNPAKIVKHRDSNTFSTLRNLDNPYTYNLFSHKKVFISKT